MSRSHARQKMYIMYLSIFGTDAYSRGLPIVFFLFATHGNKRTHICRNMIGLLCAQQNLPLIGKE